MPGQSVDDLQNADMRALRWDMREAIICTLKQGLR
jgi:hypothetical protein